MFDVIVIGDSPVETLSKMLANENGRRRIIA